MRRFLALLFCLAFAAAAQAQSPPTEGLTPTPIQHFVDSNGIALVGGKLFTYAAGTTSKINTYTDETGATPQTNPIILNSRGEPEDANGNSLGIWMPYNTAYKFVLSPSTDTDPPTNPIWTLDNIQNFAGSGGGGGMGCGDTAGPAGGTVGQDCVSTGGTGAAWGQEVIGMPAAAASGGNGTRTDLEGGAGDSAGTGGNILVYGGNGGTTGSDGDAIVGGGLGNSNDAVAIFNGHNYGVAGGSIIEATGDGTSSEGGGAYQLTTGQGSPAGDISLAAGQALATASAGASVTITAGSAVPFGSSGTAAGGDITEVTGAGATQSGDFFIGTAYSGGAIPSGSIMICSDYSSGSCFGGSVSGFGTTGQIIIGAGGNASNTGNGADVDIGSGNGINGVGGNAGNINITGGTTGTGTSGKVAGNINITGGLDDSNTNAGGTVNITGGLSDDAAGGVAIAGGAVGVGGGIAGNITLTGGAGCSGAGCTTGSIILTTVSSSAGYIKLFGLPTSCSSAPTGVLWNNSNVINICP